MYGYIYITTNLINNKKYIGQRRFISPKIEDMISDPYLGSGRDFKKAVIKYGSNNFKKEILDVCNSKDELDIKEKYWIEKYNAVKDRDFYNLTEGGTGGDTFSGLSEEDKIHCRQLNKIHNSGRTLSEEQKLNISQSLTGKQKTLEHLINEAKSFQQKGWIVIYDFTDILCYQDKEKTILVNVYQKDSFKKAFNITNEGPTWNKGIKNAIKNNTKYKNYYWDIDYTYSRIKEISPKFGYIKDDIVYGPFYGTHEMALSAIGDWNSVICSAINRVLKGERSIYHNIIFFNWDTVMKEE